MFVKLLWWVNFTGRERSNNVKRNKIKCNKNVQCFKNVWKMHRLGSALCISYYVLGIHEFTILSRLDIFSGIHLIQHYWKWNFFKKQAGREVSFVKDNVWVLLHFPTFFITGEDGKRSVLHYISCHCRFYALSQSPFLPFLLLLVEKGLLSPT